MMRKLFFHFFLLIALHIASPISAQKLNRAKWSAPVQLPNNKVLNKQPGLAGPLCGIINDKFIVAGGANFPDKLPWEGGKKTYWNDIYFLTKNKKKYAWEHTGKFTLPEKIAYCASVSMQEGLLCIGGENETGLSNKVYLLNTDDSGKKFVVKNLPVLPVALTNHAATAVGSIVFVAGGETVSSVSSRLYKLDMQNVAQGWVELANIPIEVSHTVFITQLKKGIPHLYLAGGRKRNPNSVSDFYSSLFEYNIKKNEWTKKASLPYAISAACGVLSGKNKLLIIGGDKGTTFNKVETFLAAINAEKDETKKKLLIDEKNKLQINHPGFSKDMLVYDVDKDKWKIESEIPFNVPVTTTAVKWGKSIVVPNGEIKAGVRTPQILIFK